MAHHKITAGVMDVPAGALRRWQEDGRAEVIGEGAHGVIVEKEDRELLKIELCETAEYAADTLARFYAFYDAVRRVTVIRITD